MRVAGARHGDGACRVFQAVSRFVADGFIGTFLCQVGSKATALNHESVDYAVEDGIVIKAFFGIADKVGHCFRCALFIQAEFDGAVVGVYLGQGFGLGGQAGNGKSGGQQQFGGFIHKMTLV